ncbi:uncharacterized protein [Clytia hemisphaerica]|uniref:Uncharacterized protein n=1 Tax=Clytia hemisphaerica TaxID=252671 RepID=A0A7M5UV73_9CNID|eukprot:TCONS_00053601-protein
MMNDNITQKLLLLQPKLIDPTKCNTSTSLYQQIIKNNQATSERQSRMFNLGNTHHTENPIEAAEFILEREYGDSSLFRQDEHACVFIPPTFVSNQYTKKSDVAILDYEVKKDIERLAENLKEHSPDHWLTREIQALLETQNDAECIDKRTFDQWALNIQVMYLVVRELKTDHVVLPPATTTELVVFVQACTEKLIQNTPIEKFLRESHTKKTFRKLIKRKIDNAPCEDSNLRWLFGLELVNLGERLEHWFYDQLLSLKGDGILKDTVVLSSLDFLTNMESKNHKETDFLIFSWPKKLVISVEMKRSLADEKVFKQLDSNHQIFEESLGDLLRSGWTFFPTVCVEIDTLSIKSDHFITMDTEIKPWLKNIFDSFSSCQTDIKPAPLDEVKDLLKILIFAIHVSKKDLAAPITTSSWVKYTSNAIENVSTSHNILFYSNQQLAIMNNDDPRYNKVVIRGPFGVGKSLLLQQKALQLHEKTKYRGKLLYLVCRQGYVPLKPMLLQRLKVELQDKYGIFVGVLTPKFSAKACQDRQAILDKIKDRDIKAVFIDECDLLSSLSSWLDKVTVIVEYLWIAPSTDSLKDFHKQDNLTGFQVLDLSQNFRNSREIVKSAKSIAESSEYRYNQGIIMPPENFPSGCTPIFAETFEEGLREARKRTSEGILVIDDKPDEANSNILDQLNETWKGYHEWRYDFKNGGNPYKFLQEGNVLIVSEFTSFGFEWPTVIVVETIRAGGSIALHDCNYALRCTTNLIIVKRTYDGDEDSD